MEMPYGKFKEKMMHEIPSGYLKWLSENADNDKIATAADREYQWREKNNHHWYTSVDAAAVTSEYQWREKNNHHWYD